MAPLTHLLVAAIVSLSLSLAVLWLLSPPLRRVLTVLCPDEAASAFWVSYTQIMLTLAPLLATLAVQGWVGTDFGLRAIRWTLMAAMLGLLVGLHVVGRRLGRHVRTPEPQARTRAVVPEGRP